MYSLPTHAFIAQNFITKPHYICLTNTFCRIHHEMSYFLKIELTIQMETLEYWSPLEKWKIANFWWILCVQACYGLVISFKNSLTREVVKKWHHVWGTEIHILTPKAIFLKCNTPETFIGKTISGHLALQHLSYVAFVLRYVSGFWSWYDFDCSYGGHARIQIEKYVYLVGWSCNDIRFCSWRRSHTEGESSTKWLWMWLWQYNQARICWFSFGGPFGSLFYFDYCRVSLLFIS